MGVKGFQKGHIVSDETRAKISKANNMTPQEAINIIEDVTWKDNGRHDGKIVPAREIAIFALEKQILKKPIYEDVGNVYGALKRTCANCGDVCLVSKDAKPYERYCRFCGNLLDDWSDTE